MLAKLGVSQNVHTGKGRTQKDDLYWYLYQSLHLLALPSAFLNAGMKWVEITIDVITL